MPYSEWYKIITMTKNSIAALLLATATFEHCNWMSALKEFIEDDTGLTDMQVKSPNECDLGKWINSDESSDFGNYQEFIELKEFHKNLHALGAEVVEKKRVGDIQGAKNLIKEMKPISCRIIEQIEKLKEKISQ